MILQALNLYYERKQGDLPPDGFQAVEIPFVVVIDREGNFVQLCDMRENGRARQFVVPRAETRSGTMAWARPNLLWDHYGFVFGAPKEDSAKEKETAARQHNEFVRRVAEVASRLPADHSVGAVSRFLARGDFAAVFSSPKWLECVKKKGCNLSFQLAGDNRLVSEDPGLMAFLDAGPIGEDAGDPDPVKGICLVTGNMDVIARLHPPIGGIGEKPIPLAAINDGVSPAFSSLGKSQGYNFPVGQKAAFAYATALRHLLRKDSRQRFRLADSVVVFWAEKASGEGFEQAFLDFLDPPKDDPDRGAQAVASLYSSIREGRSFTSDDRQRFHVLGLAPNVARIAVRFWHVATIGELGQAFYRHFDALEIVRPAYETAPLPLYRLLTSIVLDHKAEHIPPNLGGEVMRSILKGLPYPQTLMQGALRRIRADAARKESGRLVDNVSHPRAALLKAYLIRNLNDKEITVSLNPENTDPGYRLGRLFAALERAQELAQGNLNASIRERYYGAFSTTPITVLPLLMKLKNHHLAKLANPTFLEKTFGEIMDGLGDVPPRLSLAEQARFAVGYYHQRQAFFAKRDKENPDQPATDKE